MAGRGVQRGRRQALVVGTGEVAATFATRLAWGDCEVARRPADPTAAVPGRPSAYDAVLLADGTGLDDADLLPLDLVTRAVDALPEIRPGGVLVLVGGDGRLRASGGGGPLAVLEELTVAAEAAGVRASAVILREVLGGDAHPRTLGPAAAAGAVAADALEYLASARSQAITGAVLRAPLLRAARPLRTETAERRSVREALDAARPGT